MAASSQARKLSALRQFYGFLYAEGLRTDDPTEAIEAPQGAPAAAQDPVSAATWTRCCTTAAQDQTPEGMRLTLIVEMLYGGGLRVSELAGLPWRRCERKEDFIRVSGKGNKERLAPLSQRCAHRARRLSGCARRISCPKRDKNNRYLFCSRGEDGFLTRRRFHQLLKAWR